MNDPEDRPPRIECAAALPLRAGRRGVRSAQAPMVRYGFIAWGLLSACSSSETRAPERKDASASMNGGSVSLGGTNGPGGSSSARGSGGTGAGQAESSGGAGAGRAESGGVQGTATGGTAAASVGGAPPSATGGTASGGVGGAPSSGGGGTASGGSGAMPVVKRYGLTLDSVDALTDIVSSLRALPKRVLVRIVFDYPEQPSSYTNAVHDIAAVADIVGQPSDSTYSKQMTVAEYSARFEAYVASFPEIGIWESCNECNGDWGGPSTAAQADAAYDVIKAHGKSVLYTPYWNNPACADSNGDYLAWTRQKISAKLKQGADLVAVSIYGTDCTGGEPSYAEMNDMFDQLGQIFPNALLGIGEYGSDVVDDKERVLRYFLDYSSPHARYVFWGGYWYGKQDFVPSTKPLWKVFASGMK